MSIDQKLQDNYFIYLYANRNI